MHLALGVTVRVGPRASDASDTDAVVGVKPFLYAARHLACDLLRDLGMLLDALLFYTAEIYFRLVSVADHAALYVGGATRYVGECAHEEAARAGLRAGDG